MKEERSKQETKAKRMIALLMALTLTAAISACGDSEPAQESMGNKAEILEVEDVADMEEVSNVVTEDGEVIEDDVIEENEEIVDDDMITEDEDIVDDDEDIAEDVVNDDNIVDDENPTEDEAVAENIDNETAPVSSQNVSTPSNTGSVQTESVPTVTETPTVPESVPAAPALETTPNETSVTESVPVVSDDAQTQTSVPTSTPTPVPTQAPAHEHVWKEHTVTNQVWIPNVVTVDDYDIRYVGYSYYICDCDYETDNRDVISQHIRDHVSAGEIEFAGFTIQTRYREERVKTGSHEEDRGYYETSTYVDYYYCDCGAVQ